MSKKVSVKPCRPRACTCVCVFVKLTKDHHRTFWLKLGDYFCPLVIPEIFYAVNTEGVLDFEEVGPLDHPHIHEFKKQRYFGVIVS